MITITFTREEIQALLALMDAGVKALGRPAARACAVLDEKIAMAVREAEVNQHAANGKHSKSQEAETVAS